jgi:hypothetical protein
MSDSGHYRKIHEPNKSPAENARIAAQGLIDASAADVDYMSHDMLFEVGNLAILDVFLSGVFTDLEMSEFKDAFMDVWIPWMAGRMTERN